MVVVRTTALGRPAVQPGAGCARVLPEDDLVFFLLDLVPQIDLALPPVSTPKSCAANRLST